MQAILLAAGFGTRLLPYTAIKPKPLFPVCNKPLLHYLIEKLQACDCEKIIVNCHHLADQIEQALFVFPEVELQREPEILGTGGSLREALPRLSDAPLLVMNGDLFHSIDLAGLYKEHLASAPPVTMAMHDYQRFNTVEVVGKRIRGFSTGKTGNKLAFTGVHVVDPELLTQIPGHGFYHIIDLYEQLARLDKIGINRVDGCHWHDIGTPADYLGLHGDLLAKGSWVIDPAADVEDGVVLEDWGCVGKGAVIRSGARLKRCVVWDDAVVSSNDQYADTIVTGKRKINTGCDNGQ